MIFATRASAHPGNGRQWLAGLCLAAALPLAAMVGRAETGVMNWEDDVGCASSWTASGLVFTNARGTICTDTGSGINSVSSGSRFSNDVEGLRIVHESGLPFTPLSIDLGEYSRSVIAPSVEFIGYREDGTTVSVQFPLDGIADGPAGAPDFQTFSFPASFANIVRLEVPTAFWSFDDFVFTAGFSPPLPTGQQLGASYRSAVTRLTKSIHDNIYIVGPDYTFASGFSAPNGTQFILAGDTSFVPDTYSPHYSRTNGRLCFVNYTRTAVFAHQAGSTTTIATPSDTTATDWPMSRLDLPRYIDGALVFLGYDLTGSDQFAVFLKQSETTIALITPQTELPSGPTGQGSTPFDFPQNIATTPNGFIAFDTSLAASPTTKRLYVTHPGGGFFQYIAGQNDIISTGSETATLVSFESFAFTDDGFLEVRATLSTGPARLYYTPGGLQQIATPLTVAPVNAGKTVIGLVSPLPPYPFFGRPRLLTTTDGELYQESNGRYFRIIGVGDQIEGQTISLLELKSPPATLPPRVIVEVRYVSNPGAAHIVEIELAEPVTHPPRFGGVYVHPESGDWYIPLSHTTADKTQWLSRSTDLQTWERLRRIESVSPLQHVIIPRAQTQLPKVFFRVEEE